MSDGGVPKNDKNFEKGRQAHKVVFSTGYGDQLQQQTIAATQALTNFHVRICQPCVVLQHPLICVRSCRPMFHVVCEINCCIYFHKRSVRILTILARDSGPNL